MPWTLRIALGNRQSFSYEHGIEPHDRPMARLPAGVIRRVATLTGSNRPVAVIRGGDSQRLPCRVRDPYPSSYSVRWIGQRRGAVTHVIPVPWRPPLGACRAFRATWPGSRRRYRAHRGQVWEACPRSPPRRARTSTTWSCLRRSRDSRRP